jgi:hypothetical protein
MSKKTVNMFIVLHSSYLLLLSKLGFKLENFNLVTLVKVVI